MEQLVATVHLLLEQIPSLVKEEEELQLHLELQVVLVVVVQEEEMVLLQLNQHNQLLVVLY